MRRRTTAMAAALVAATLVVAPTPPTASAGADDVIGYQDWSVTVGDGSSGHIADSTPVVIDNGGDAFVVSATRGGNVVAHDLDTGDPVTRINSDFDTLLRAPLSTNGSDIFVPLHQDGKDNRPRAVRIAGSNGNVAWDTNPGADSGDFMLAGMSIDLQSDLVTIGSSGHWIYGIDRDDGVQRWAQRNADSTMATPVIADLYGTGTPQVITSSTTSREFPTDRNGGILRILTNDGRQICTATQLVTGDTYAVEGYNLSTPAVAEVDGQPRIFFGSTGPTQYGSGANQVLAYDRACNLVWASTPLNGRAQPSTTVADVLGTGTPQVLQVVQRTAGSVHYPQVYVLDARTGAVLTNTTTSLQSFGDVGTKLTQATSIVTADVDSDGVEEMIVPGRYNRLLVLEGDGSVLGYIPTNAAIQNTPIVTEEPGGGIRVTIAGYSAVPGGSAGRVSSYLIPGGQLLDSGWHRFGADSQLTGVNGPLVGPKTQLLDGDTLEPGDTLTSPNGELVATMTPGGNFELRNGQGDLLWQTNTDTPGSRGVITGSGRFEIRRPDDSVAWTSGSSTATNGVERLALDDGGLVLYRGSSAGGTRLLITTTATWSVTACDHGGAHGFTDVPAGSTFCTDVAWMASEGISNGYPDNTYRPTKGVTRQEMSAFLARQAGVVLTPCTAAPFEDVDPGSSFCPAIQWMDAQGISEGYDDDTFRPTVTVTRGQMSAFLARAFGPDELAACATAPFDDVGIDHMFCAQIGWMADSGVSNGYGDHTYRPAATVRRGEMSAFLHRAADLE